VLAAAAADDAGDSGAGGGLIVSDQAAFQRLGRLRYLCWDLTLYRRPAARWAALAVRARPSATDHATLALPPGLGFLYYPVRLVRVLAAVWAARRTHPDRRNNKSA
jgi:hypothetical protein